MPPHPKASIGPEIPATATSQGAINAVPVPSQPAKNTKTTKNGNIREDR